MFPELSRATASEWTQATSEDETRKVGDCAQVSPGTLGPVVMSSKTWNAATGDKSPELERQAEACFLEQPTAAAAFCKFVLTQDSVMVHVLTPGSEGSSGGEEETMEQGVMCGWVHTSDLHLLLSSRQWNESF